MDDRAETLHSIGWRLRRGHTRGDRRWLHPTTGAEFGSLDDAWRAQWTIEGDAGAGDADAGAGAGTGAEAWPGDAGLCTQSRVICTIRSPPTSAAARRSGSACADADARGTSPANGNGSARAVDAKGMADRAARREWVREQSSDGFFQAEDGIRDHA